MARERDYYYRGSQTVIQDSFAHIPIWAAITKYHKVVSLQTTEIYVTQF